MDVRSMAQGKRSDPGLEKQRHRKISAALKGRTFSAAHRANLKGRVLTPEWKQALSAAAKGKRLSVERRQQIGESVRKSPRSIAQRARLHASNIGRVRSPKTRAAMSAGQKASPTLPARTERLRQIKTGKPLSESHRQALSRAAKASPRHQAHIKALHQGEHKRRAVETWRRWWQSLSDEEQAQYISKRHRALKAQMVLGTALEQAVKQSLSNLGVTYERQVIIGRYCVDFLLPPALIIECDGHYWHSSAKQKQHDVKRDAYLAARGYRVVRLTEEAIKQNPYQAVLGALQQWPELERTSPELSQEQAWPWRWLAPLFGRDGL